LVFVCTPFSKFLDARLTADAIICDHAARLSKFGMLIVLLKYNIVTSN